MKLWDCVNKGRLESSLTREIIHMVVNMWSIQVVGSSLKDIHWVLQVRTYILFLNSLPVLMHDIKVLSIYFVYLLM